MLMEKISEAARRAGTSWRVTMGAAVLLAASTGTQADAKTLVLECKGVERCASCATDQRQTNFDWTYTVDLSASTVDSHPATISDELIVWTFSGNGVSDRREISRYSKKLHFAGTSTSGSGEIYSGDGNCELQATQAF